MLERLKLTNVALFEEQVIDFDNGFNCLIGETGAGKSIIIDALSFVIGAKSDKLLIRNDKDFVRVEALFTNVSSDVIAKLASFGLEESSELVVSRSLNRSGRNDVRVNGSMVTLSFLKEVGQLLVSMYGQHENLMLLNDKNHLNILDSYKSEKTDSFKAELKSIISELALIDEKIEALGGDGAAREREIEILNYQINEIESANLQIDEDEELSKIISRMSGHEKVVESLNVVLDQVDNGVFSVATSLKLASKELSSLVKYDEKYDALSRRLEEAAIDVIDVVETLEDDKNNSYFDQNELERLIEREQLIKKLKRKYGASISEVLQYLDEIVKKKDQYENADYEISKLEKARIALLEKAKLECDKLTNIRRELAKEIELGVEEQLVDLGMKNTTFKISITAPEEFSKNSFNANGQDSVKFLFSANIGQDLKSLSKTISGGEMSRFMLAVKNVLRNQEGLIAFDEVDSGISGQIALSVAQKIARISKSNQIICISHLPQVCSMADNFLKVEKFVKDNKTFSHVLNLSGDEVVDEIAVMCYGENLSENAHAYANELIENNKKFKASICE